AREGGLEAIFAGLNADNPKLQIGIDRGRHVGEESEGEELDSNRDNFGRNQYYLQLRLGRKMYALDSLQVACLSLIISLMLTENGTLETLYNDKYPLDKGKMNIPFLLHHHLNHSANRDVIPKLVEATHQMGEHPFRLLKLLCTHLFDPSRYKQLVKIAQGGYGAVYFAVLEDEGGSKVAVKLMNLPKTPHDRCVVHDIFTEISVLDRFKSDPRVSTLYAYGVSEEYFWMAMKPYKTSLRTWRKRQTAPLSHCLNLYLNVFASCLTAYKFLDDHQVNHYDIKCDNFLLEPLRADLPEEEFWDLTGTDIPNFSVCLADFGEAKIWSNEEDAFTTHNRGTEFMKSPEMLIAGGASRKTQAGFDRRKKVGAAAPSDIWSLGCMFYELLTGDFLFDEGVDFFRFYIRVTLPGQELIRAECRSKLDNNPVLIEFLMWMLDRDPTQRPTIDSILRRFHQVRSRIRSQSGNTALITGSDQAVLDSKKLATLPEPAPNDSKLIKSMFRQAQLRRRTQAELRFFMEHVTQITDFLFIGSAEVATQGRRYLKHQLDITHIINCTDSHNDHPWDFIYLQLEMYKDGGDTLDSQLDSAQTFINTARSESGKVFIYSDDGNQRAATLAIGYLMEAESITYTEAFNRVKDKRYTIRPPSDFVYQLCQRYTYIETDRNKYNLRFRCVCGACSYGIITPFGETRMKSCCCGVPDAATQHDCPTANCTAHLRLIAETSGFVASDLHWCYTPWSNLKTSTLIIATQQTFTPADASSSTSATTPSGLPTEAWRLFSCIGCGYLTHAINRSDSSSVAIVTNLRIQ
ncbi:MAG: dual specificity protein phosphatase PHS1 family protein, partial [archaeon]|nr:dual specificity protein phosphatase PHS1 family protein [archaeon]